jgi:hypothetical protein
MASEKTDSAAGTKDIIDRDRVVRGEHDLVQQGPDDCLLLRAAKIVAGRNPTIDERKALSVLMSAFWLSELALRRFRPVWR